MGAVKEMGGGNCFLLAAAPLGVGTLVPDSLQTRTLPL